jgi:hypothetical protein
VVGLQRSLAHRVARSVIVLPPVRRRVDKSGLALISPPMSAPLFKREVSVRRNVVGRYGIVVMA